MLINEESKVNIKNISLSNESERVIQLILERNYFNEQMEVAKFAFAFAIAREYDTNLDLETYSLTEGRNNKWSSGSFKDNDTFYTDIIRLLHPEVKSVNLVIRNLIEIGLKEIGLIIDKKPNWVLSDLL